MILSLSVVSWAEYARLARALTLQEKNKNYMTALKSRRLRPRKDHIQACIEKYPAICDRTGNNGNRFDHSVNCRFFLYRPWCAGTDTGMGIMLSDSKSYIQTYPRLMFYPGILIMIIVLAFNYLGEGIQNGTDKK